MLRFTLAVRVIALGLLPAVPVCAQTSTLDDTRPDGGDVVVTGTKTGDFGVKSGIPVNQTPQSIQIVDAADILATGARTIEDALRVVPSATVARNRVSGFAGNTLRIRGFAAQQIRNGIFQRFYDSTDPSALSDVARIEILKGPSAVLYGQSGVGGIVSIITKQPTDAPTATVALTGGSYDQKMVTVDAGAPLSDTLGIRLTGEIERSGSFVDHLDVDRENVGLALAWRPSDAISAHLVAEYLHRRTLANPGLPTVGTVIGNGLSRVKRSTYLGEPSYSLQENDAPLIQAWVDVKVGGGWTLTPRVQYSAWRNTVRSTTLLPPVAPDLTIVPRIGRDAGENDRFYVAQLDLTGNVATYGMDHALIVGVEYNHDVVPFRMASLVPCGIRPIDALDPRYGCGAPTPAFGFLSRATLAGIAVYAQDRIALSPRWHVVAGIRQSGADNRNSFVTAFSRTDNSARLRNTSWQVGSTYALRAGFSLFGGYNTGYDLGAVTGSRRFDTVAFKPETSNQLEAGVRLARHTIRAALSAFRIRRDNVAVPDPANAGFQRQDGRFRTRGIELEGEWSPRPGWWLQGGYAYLDAAIVRSTIPALVGGRIAETPRNAVTAATRIALGRLELRAAANRVGARRIVNGGDRGLPGYATVDVGGGSSFGPVRIDATLTNLFDRTYYFTDNLSRYSLGTEDRVLPGEPRAITLRLAYRFAGVR